MTMDQLFDRANEVYVNRFGGNLKAQSAIRRLGLTAMLTGALKALPLLDGAGWRSERCTD